MHHSISPRVQNKKEIAFLELGWILFIRLAFFFGNFFVKVGLIKRKGSTCFGAHYGSESGFFHRYFF